MSFYVLSTWTFLQLFFYLTICETEIRGSLEKHLNLSNWKQAVTTAITGRRDDTRVTSLQRGISIMPKFRLSCLLSAVTVTYRSQRLWFLHYSCCTWRPAFVVPCMFSSLYLDAIYHSARLLQGFTMFDQFRLKLYDWFVHNLLLVFDLLVFLYSWFKEILQRP